MWISGIGGPPSICGRPAPRPDPDQPAAGERVERLDHLVARAERVGEGVEPDRDADPDVIEQQRHQQAAEDEEDEPDHDQADPARGDVEERQEHAEEEQRGAEVALDDHDAEGDRPHRDHRQEVRHGRQPQRADPRVLLHEERTVLREVARQEDHEDHLEELRRLAADRPDREREPRAVDVGAEDEREQQQGDADRRPRVLVAAQPGVGADDDRQRREDRDREDEPDQLDLGQPERRPEEVLRDEVLGQALHQQKRDPAEETDDRQQDLVRPATGEHLGEVRAEQGEHVDEQAARIGEAERPVDRRAEREAADHQRDADEGQQPRLLPPWARPDRTEDPREGGRRPGRPDRSGGHRGRAIRVAAARAASGPGRPGSRRRTRAVRRPRSDGRSRTCRSCSRGPRRTTPDPG